jgi:hypothetical protein
MSRVRTAISSSTAALEALSKPPSLRRLSGARSREGESWNA